MTKLTFEAWKDLVLTKHPQAQFTKETGAGETYGELGDWTAHVGPDMQADVVGAYVTGEFCSVYDEDGRLDREFGVSCET